MRWIDERGRTEGLVKGGDERRKFREGIQMCRKRAKHKKTAVFKELKKKIGQRGERMHEIGSK